MTSPFHIDEEQLIVFAADQAPFGDAPNKFCTLYPLMSIDGSRLSADEIAFPGRGRVWWKLRPEHDDYVLPGSVWVGFIESAPSYRANDPYKDKYQVLTRDFQLGHNELIEIIDVDEEDPDLDVIYRNKKLYYEKPVVKQVFLRGKKNVVGPLKASWSHSDRMLSFSVSNTARPEVLKVPLDTFKKFCRLEQFSYQANQHHVNASLVPISITLSKSSWIDLAKLREHGKVIPAYQDSEIINWAAKQVGLSNAQRSEVKSFLLKAGEDNAVISHEKYERFFEIAQDKTRIIEQGEDVAKVLASTYVFEELIARHFENILSTRIQDEIRRREKEIQTSLESLQKQKKAIESDLKQLQADYDKKCNELDQDLKEVMVSRIKGIESKEKQLEEREKAITEQEEKIAARLDRLVQQYREEAERIGDEIFAQLPLLARAGFASGGPKEREQGKVISASKMLLPKFLEKSKQVDAALSEQQFLEQLKRVVEQRGFIFPAENLINFHVCMKTGGLTILAGPSGTGKSSLPRLYAEALGCSDEYLHIPVRPDWLDDKDLVGAYNPLARRFEPANSGLIDRLIAAWEDEQQKRGGIYFICFDEMNLARVEHYFAQFLSVSEKRASERSINLFSEGLANPEDPYSAYRVIHLNQNLRFIGTVNIDETTHFFSPKILDRAQVLSFGCADLESAELTAQDNKIGGITPVTLETFSSWIQPSQKIDGVRENLLRVNDILKTSRLGLTYRPFKRILSYVESARPFFTDDQALDFQFVQVVFPRLRNTAPQFEKTLEGLKKEISAERFPRSAEILQRIEDSGDEYEYFQLL